MRGTLVIAALATVACGGPEPDEAKDAGIDAGTAPMWIDSCGHPRPDRFIDSLISFTPGSFAGFGQEKMPCIVEGPPEGMGSHAGSLDVVSLGYQGEIVVRFDDVEIVDGPGPDLIVFENPFIGWYEPGFIAVSDDGVSWTEWPCEPENADAGYPFCGGVHPVFSNSQNGISPFDPAAAGGDAFDLADIGVKQAHYVRVRDSGYSHYCCDTGGFDLDAMAAINSVPRPDAGL